jgi:ubiquinone biosynthesis protein
MVTSARAHARELLGPQLDPTHVRATLEDQLLALAPALQRLPRRLTALGDQLEQGRFSMNLRLLAHPEDRSFVDGSCGS